MIKNIYDRDDRVKMCEYLLKAVHLIDVLLPSSGHPCEVFKREKGHSRMWSPLTTEQQSELSGFGVTWQSATETMWKLQLQT